MKKEKIKKIVRKSYADIAKDNSPCCEQQTSCCETSQAEIFSRQIGYTSDELEAVPEGSNLGLGCGNPTALASLNEGEIVLDLGSGAGFDSFLAANQVSKKGKVIGIDMTPEMVEKARENAKRGGYDNVEFKFGEIENLPLPDACVDVIISNCVINLSPDKKKVFQESFRVLKPGGRLMISDIVLLKELPESIKNSVEAYVGCVSGATLKKDYLGLMKEAGFQELDIKNEAFFSLDCVVSDSAGKSLAEKLGISDEQLKEVEKTILSISVSGTKPE